MQKGDKLLKEYEVSHQNPTNKLIHYVCVPLIFFSTVGLFSLIRLPFLATLLPTYAANLATVLISAALIFYLINLPKLLFGILLYLALCLYIILELNTFEPVYSLIIYASIFILAWIGQFIGHAIEGAKPSFLKDLQFLLIGPAWITRKAYEKLKFYQ